MKWFYMTGPGGTITCKGEFAGQAVIVAAERWDCDPAEIQVVGEAPYHGTPDRNVKSRLR